MHARTKFVCIYSFTANASERPHECDVNRKFKHTIISIRKPLKPLRSGAPRHIVPGNKVRTSMELDILNRKKSHLWQEEEQDTQ